MKKTPSLLLAAVTIAGLLAVVPSTAQAALGEWDPPVTLSAEGQDASSQQVVTDGITITAIWSRFDGNNDRIETATSNDGGTSWSTPIILSAEGRPAFNPQLVTNGETITAIWEWIGVTRRIQAASSIDGGSTWSTPVNVSAEGQSAGTPQMVTSGTTITVVWLAGSTGTIWAASSPNGGTAWTPPTELSTTGQLAWNPQLAADETTVTAIWQRSNGTNDVIQTASSIGGGPWTTPAALSDTGQDAVNPQIVTDGTRVTATWQRSDGSNTLIQAASSANGGAWSAPVTLSDSGGNAVDPQLVTDGRTVTVIWERFNGNNFVIQASSSSDGTTWRTPIDVSPTSVQAFTPQIVTDGVTITAVWERFAGPPFQIQAASSTDGGATWNTPTTLSDATGNTSNPQIVTDGRTITASWDKFDGTHKRIQSSSFTAVLQVSRLAGADRYETAVVIANEFDPDVPVVYLATGTNYPDALSAASAAAFQGGPLLLTTPTTLPQLVRDELVRLNPGLVVIVGGTGVVSTAVEAQVVAALPITVTVRRDAGDNRYETSRIIAEEAFPAGATTAFIATGTNFPDALSASAAAGAAGAPVILVDGRGTSIDMDTQNLLTDLGVTEVVIAGGTGVVSEAIEDALGLVVGPTNVTRLSGADRYATSVAINSVRFTTTPTVFLATGLGFADALAGAAVAGNVGAPLYVVPGTCVPTSVLTEIDRLNSIEVILLGGTGVLTVDVANLIRC